MRIEDMKHLNMRMWRHKNIKITKIEDEKTCNMCFTPICFWAFLNKFSTVRSRSNTPSSYCSGAQPALKFLVPEHLEKYPEDGKRGFCIRVWGFQILAVRIVRTDFGGKTPKKTKTDKFFSSHTIICVIVS